MENRYTKQAREALDAAEVYAKELKHPYIGTEHLLMGLRTSISGVAAQVLEMNGLREEDVRKVVGELVSRVGDEPFSGRPKESPRLKVILDGASAACHCAGYRLCGSPYSYYTEYQSSENYAGLPDDYRGKSESSVRPW